MTMNREAAATFLVLTQDAAGGWGYQAGETAAVEPTAAALLALQEQDAAAAARGRGLGWLRAGQQRDGGWGFNAGDRESGWTTAWGLLALAAYEPDGAAARRAIDWLLGVAVLDFRLDDIQSTKDTLGIDLALRGWPWLPGMASFVEPTAWAALALAVAGEDGAAGRLAEAARYLQDRRCRPGGWNVGNPVMFSQALPPRAQPTAWALLALHRLAPDSITAADTAALSAEMHREDSTSALAWGLMALAALGDTDAEAEARLAARQRGDGSWEGSPYLTALALLSGAGALR